MSKEPFVKSLWFTLAMTLVSVLMLVKSAIIVLNTAHTRSEMFDLIIWAVMAVTWLVALILRLLHKNR